MSFVDLYGGDRPTFFFDIGKSRFVLQSNDKKQWEVFTHLEIDLTEAEKRESGFKPQPEFAFVLSNGSESISVMWNAGQYVFSFGHKKRHSFQAFLNLSKKAARRVSESLLFELTNPEILTRETKNVTFKPVNSFYRYRAVRTSYSAR